MGLRAAAGIFSTFLDFYSILSPSIFLGCSVSSNFTGAPSIFFGFKISSS
jgi:hypothetical protein